MATWSNYIDGMLSSNMKEGQTKKITFPEIAHSEWEAMVMYLEPGAGEILHVDEAKRLAKWYDKYEFQTGLAMCDRVIHDYITSEEDHDLGAKSDAYSVACNHNLVRSQKGGTSFFAKLLQDPLRRSRLALADISTLAPLTGRMDELWAAVKDILPTIEGQVNRELLVQETCFPMFLYQAIEKEALAHVGVRVKGAGLDCANGIYVIDGTFDGDLKFAKRGIWRGKEEIFSLYRYKNQGSKRWFISIVPVGSEPGTNDDIDFYCNDQSTQDTDYPPGQGWVEREESAEPAPVIEYQLTHQW
jgi:hypothetical protein